MKALNAKPRTKPAAASAMRLLSADARRAPAAPHAPHASIWYGVHGPCTSRKLETNAASIPTPTPARSPSAAPATIAVIVTGWTPGTAAKRTRPAAAAPPSVATSAISFAESGPPSSQTTAAASSDAATSQIDRRESPVAASTSATANASAAATKTTRLDKDLLPAERDDAIRDRGREHAVVRDHQRRAVRRIRAEQRGERPLALWIHAAGRLVEHEQA